jgi:monofunctional biosynthetic peptidoglycan transglycosylase
MKRISIMVLLSLCLISCANNQATLPSSIDFEANIAMTDPLTTDIESTLPPTKNTPDSTESSTVTPKPVTTTLLPGLEIFTFGNDEPTWYTVDDNVMGGVSSSNVDIIDSDILLFSGTMSLDNNGGFSSVRSDWKPTNLKDSDGVLLRVLGDGKMYRIRIRSAKTGSEISYNAAFETTPETWKLVYIPFVSMVPTYRGLVMNVETLDPSSIGSFGFMLSDKQPGEFRLLVDWIRAVSEEELRAFGLN